MKHIDEGTIHAWLDGALDEARASEVSSHAAACAECSALVAEARGLVAGASRILTSLDDVPVVAPKRAPSVASNSPARRSWQAAPWVTGIAAALILAVGLKTWLDKPQAEATFAARNRQVLDSLVVAPPTPTVLAESASRLRPVNAPAVASGVASGVAPRRTIAPSTVSQRAVQSGIARGPEVASAAGAGGAVPAAAPPAVPSELARKEATADMIQLEATQKRADVPGQQLAGCYRFDGLAVKAASEAPATTKAVASARDARSRLAPAAAAPSANAGVRAFSMPAILRLDTVTAGRPRSVVLVESGEVLGVWVPAVGDSVRVFWTSGSTHTLSSTNRITCPPNRE